MKDMRNNERMYMVGILPFSYGLFYKKMKMTELLSLQSGPYNQKTLLQQ